MPKLIKDAEHPNLFVMPGTGRYYFRKYLTEAGGEIYRSLKTKSRSQAIREMNRMLSDLRGFVRRSDKISINEVVAEMYEGYQQKARATFQGFESCCRLHILPYYNNTEIGNVASSWEPFKARVKRDNPEMSLVHVRRHVLRILRYSARRKYLTAVPELDLDPGEIKTTQSRPYDSEELNRLLTAEPDPAIYQFKKATLRKLRLQLRLVLFCGLRPPSEIRNLKWEYFDFERMLLRLPASFVKTRTSREVRIDETLLNELKTFQTKSKIKSEFVFPMRGKKNLPSSSTDKSWQRFKRAIRFTGKRYWVRHTHATALVESGAPAMVVAQNMGTSEKMLKRVYVQSKIDPNLAVKAIREKLGKNSGSDACH